MSKALRRVVDVVGALTAAGVLSVVGVFGYQHYQREKQIKAVDQALHEFERVLAVQSASKQVEQTARGWPVTLEPAWFRSTPPVNPLVSIDRPWVEIASEDEADLADPPVRIAAARTTAAFWYNPYRGVVRARVPLLTSEQKTIDLYNRVNGSAVQSGYQPLVKDEPPPTTDPNPAGAPPKERMLPRIRVSGTGTKTEEPPSRP